MKKYLDFSYEENLISSKKYSTIVGIDEVGRGAWAGPVTVGAFILDRTFIKTAKTLNLQVNDSKLLSPKQRVEQESILKEYGHIIKTASVQEIDKEGIGKAITNLILNIVKEINSNFNNPFIIIDGRFSSSFAHNCIKKDKADSTFFSVAAASVLAKVYRDNLMSSLGMEFPLFYWERNKGYPSQEHLKALRELGATIHHRKSFGPIGQMELSFDNF